MKTAEEIKKGLVEVIEEASWVVEGGDAHDLIDVVDKAHASMADALAYIQQLERENKDLLEERELNDCLRDKVQQLEAQTPKWISVEERLPEDNVNVLVYAIGNNENSVIAMTGYTHNMYGYNIEGWRSPWQYFFYEYRITHWMPLPEGPKEG